LGEDEEGAAHGEGNEEAGPFVAIVEFYGNPGRVQENDPEEKHESKQERGETEEDFESHAEAGGDEGDAGEVCKKQSRGHPGGNQGSNEWGIEKMLNSKNDRADGEDEAAKQRKFSGGGIPGIAERRLGGKKRGEDERGRAKGERFEGASAVVAVVNHVVQMLGVEDENEKEEEKRDEGGADSRFPVRRDARASDDENCADEIGADPATRRPGRNGRESSLIGAVDKILATESDERQRKEKAPKFEELVHEPAAP